MKRTVNILFRENGIEKVRTVKFNQSLLEVFDELKSRDALILDIIASWQ